MPKPYPSEFRDDVVRVAQNREPGFTIEQIAKDFSVHPMTLQKWLARDKVETGAVPGTTRSESIELREARKRIQLLEQENEVLRRAAAYLSQANLPGKALPARVRARRFEDPRDGDVPGSQAPTTGGWLTPSPRARWWRRITRTHCSTPTKTTPSSGTGSSPTRPVATARRCRTAPRGGSRPRTAGSARSGSPSAAKRRRPGPAAHDDLCAVVDEHGRTRHVFAADAPNQLWLTDITEHKTAEGKLYLCAIKDVYSGRIVGDSIDSRMKSRLAVQTLENAVAMRGDVAGRIVHSDRGSQFRSRKMRRTASRHRMVGSMGRAWPSGDNAAMESFFALLQKNVLDRHTWTTREQLWIAMVTWIERTYHRRRRQARLGRLTPIEFETITNTAVALAA